MTWCQYEGQMGFVLRFSVIAVKYRLAELWGVVFEIAVA